VSNLREVYSQERQGWEAAHQEQQRRYGVELESLKASLMEKEEEVGELV